MSYLVFARKYRPLTFEDVVGQQHITQTLCRAIENNRVAHAYIFTGTRGVGKTTTARILARALNCDKGPTVRPCGQCESCRQVIAGSSLDVLEIDGASNRGVDDIRQLRESVGYSSMSGKHRVIVIDEVHMLTREAFNALLKTLEEPPPGVIFIFATTEPHRIPATIHSRCQRYDFRRISAEQIRAQLATICDTEKVAYEAEGLALVARKADGSMRDALSLLDQVHSYCQETIRLDDVRTVLGVVGGDVYGRLLQAIHDKQPEPALSIVQDVLYKGYDLQEFVVGLQEYLRDLLLVRLPGANAESPAGSTTPELRQQAELFAEHALLRMADHVRRGERDLRQSAYPRFLIETLLLRLVYMDDTVSFEQLLRIVAGGATGAGEPASPQAAPPVVPEKKNSIASPPAPEPPPFVIPPSAPVAVDEPMSSAGTAEAAFASDSAPGPTRDVRADWKAFLDKLVEDRPNLATFLGHAKVVSYSGTSLDLRFLSKDKFQFEEVCRQQNRQILEKELAAFAGAAVELHITHESAKQNPETAAIVNHAGADRAPSLEDEIESEPIIKTILDVFDGEILQ